MLESRELTLIESLKSDFTKAGSLAKELDRELMAVVRNSLHRAVDKYLENTLHKQLTKIKKALDQ
jgi:hypothetical protein